MRKLLARLRGLMGLAPQLSSLHAELADWHQAAAIEQRHSFDDLKLLAGKPAAWHVTSGERFDPISTAEFKAFSQFGDDGIIQYLTSILNIEPRTFVEFGVEDYRESNTRYLLLNNNWRGLVIDSDLGNITRIKADEIFWRHDLSAVAAYVRTDNINLILDAYGFSGPLGLLSIDIDGNDYHVWEAITAAEPVLVVCEYNSVFGADLAVTIPYDPTFRRTKAHHSNLYFGASLKALCILAERKGYAFVGSNSAGNNAYFVRRDRLSPLRALTCAEGYVRSLFRESRDLKGQFNHLAGDERLAEIAGMPVYDVEAETLTTLTAHR